MGCATDIRNDLRCLFVILESLSHSLASSSVNELLSSCMIHETMPKTRDDNIVQSHFHILCTLFSKTVNCLPLLVAQELPPFVVSARYWLVSRVCDATNRLFVFGAADYCLLQASSSTNSNIQLIPATNRYKEKRTDQLISFMYHPQCL